MSSSNVSIVNVVGGGELGVQMDLAKLYNELNVEEIEYEPETSPMLKFKIHKDGPTVMLFSSGSYFLAGAISIKQAKKVYCNMVSEVENLGVDTKDPYFEIRNIVCKFEFEREFELSELSIALGLEHCEYNPEHSPGIICRFTDCTGVFHIFRTGVILLTGSKTMEEIPDNIRVLVDRLDEIGIDVSNPVAD